MLDLGAAMVKKNVQNRTRIEPNFFLAFPLQKHTTTVVFVHSKQLEEAWDVIFSQVLL